ncbi:MAG: hypothetical protein KDI79_24730 [Anaerolineae bacterium]|nr:hypothetical protein [Anaerolineae bacterium]
MKTLKRWLKWGWLVIWVVMPLVAPQSMRAQGGSPPDPPEARPDDIKFEHLTIDDGLPNNFTSFVLQDDRGFIWVGTKEGLSKYDGSEFTVYTHDPNDPNSLSRNFVQWIDQDSRATLWVSSWGGGLNQYDPVNDNFIHYHHNERNPDSLAHDDTWAVFEDSQGRYWVSTIGGGLDQFDPGTETFTHFGSDNDNPNSLVSDWVVDIDVDSTGVVWVASAAGVSAYNFGWAPPMG